MKQYKVKPEHWDAWFGGMSTDEIGDAIVDEKELLRLSAEWGTDLEELLEQVEEVEPHSKYKLIVIGEKEPLFYSDVKIAFDAKAYYQSRGKYAILMSYNPETGDYDIGL